MSRAGILSVIVLGGILLNAAPGLALIEVIPGNQPVPDRGLPQGAIEVGNLPNRIQCVLGPPFGTGSEYRFQYQGDTPAFNQALERFAGVVAPKLELVVHNGPGTSNVGGDRLDWEFNVWIAERWNELYNGPRSFTMADRSPYNEPVPPPRIDLYVGGGGGVVWEQVKVPPKVSVIDKRPQSVSPEFAGKGLVRIRVLDMETGGPVAATVVLTRLAPNEPNAKTIDGVTRGDGSCQIAGIEPGHYEIRVAAQGYAARVLRDGYDNRNPEYYESTVRLARESSISGRVVDSSGRGLGGVEVRTLGVIASDGSGYRRAGETKVVTDANGAFVVSHLPKGRVGLATFKKGLHQETSIFEQHDVPSRDVTLVVGATGVIRGRVIDPSGNAPVGQVRVEARPPGDPIGKWSGSAICASDGTFQLEDVPAGQYLLTTEPVLPNAPIPANAQQATVTAGQISQVEITLAKRQTPDTGANPRPSTESANGVNEKD